MISRASSTVIPVPSEELSPCDVAVVGVEGLGGVNDAVDEEVGESGAAVEALGRSVAGVHSGVRWVLDLGGKFSDIRLKGVVDVELVIKSRGTEVHKVVAVEL